MRVAWLILAGCGRIAFDLDRRGDATAIAGTGDLCTISADTVALYSFSRDEPAGDSTGGNSGALRGNASWSMGPCGDAIVLSGTSYVLVPDSPAFDLEAGSIDLFVRVTTSAAASQVLVSRDANGSVVDGHFLLAIGTQGHISARLQRQNDFNAYRCADFVPSSQWTHVGVSFSGTAEQGFRMWIDHEEAALTQIDDFPFVGTVRCGDPHPYGIAGNDNALVIGGSAYNAIEGSPDPLVQDLFAGELDQVRVSASWRDFSRP